MMLWFGGGLWMEVEGDHGAAVQGTTARVLLQRELSAGRDDPVWLGPGTAGHGAQRYDDCEQRPPASHDVRRAGGAAGLVEGLARRHVSAGPVTALGGAEARVHDRAAKGRGGGRPRNED